MIVKGIQHLIYAKLIIVFTTNLEFSPILKSYKEVQHSTNVNKVAEKLSTVQLGPLDLSLIFFIPMSQTSLINKTGTCYFSHKSN